MTDLPPLPEPDLERGTKMVPYEDRYFGTPGLASKLGYSHETRHYYTTAKVQAYARDFARAVRAQTLEDAAELCDRFAERGMHPAECAAAIRGMK